MFGIKLRALEDRVESLEGQLESFKIACKDKLAIYDFVMKRHKHHFLPRFGATLLDGEVFNKDQAREYLANKGYRFVMMLESGGELWIKS